MFNLIHAVISSPDIAQPLVAVACALLAKLDRKVISWDVEHYND